MKRIALTLIILTATGAMAQLRTPGRATIKLYYPGDTPVETISVPDTGEYKVDGWSIDNGCIHFKQGKETTIFCGTFKVIRGGT